MKKNIWLIIGAFGFLLLLGTAGSADTAHLELVAMALRLAVSFGIMGLSALFYRRAELQEEKRRRMMRRRQQISHTHQAA